MALQPITTLKTFFGPRPGTDGTLKEFAEECKALSSEEKTELANLAKAELIRVGTHKAEDFGF